MAAISLITPLDQPTGNRRLLTELKTSLAADLFDEFWLVVAFAKTGPLLRLRPNFESWRKAGKKIRAIFGISMRGTSKQALSVALELFDDAYVTREPRVTFHPKMYLFTSKDYFRCFVGSGNLTVGGTETNFEACVRVDGKRPEEEELITPFIAAWKELLPGKCPATQSLTTDLITKWNEQDLLLDETVARNTGADRRADAANLKAPRSLLTIKPPSPLPPKAVPKQKKATAKAAVQPKAPAAPVLSAAAPAASSDVGTALAMQIRPHPNGEIHLSVIAALQNPAFFGWPFQGKTTPKKKSNPSYPQRDPDPIVNIAVYGTGAEPKLVLLEYPLNTVYYEKNSEIRITASPLVGSVPDFSILIIRRSDIAGIDYEMVIHRPDSPEHPSWLAACNQQMPGGGKQPRKFGWF